MNQWPIITGGTVVLAVIVAVFGGIAVIQGKLAYDDYCYAIAILGGGMGLGAGIGRGTSAAKKAELQAQQPTVNPYE